MSLNESGGLLDTAELAQFRQQWKVEVQRRKEAGRQALEAESLVSDSSSGSANNPSTSAHHSDDNAGDTNLKKLISTCSEAALKNVASHAPDTRRKDHGYPLTNVSESSSKRVDSALVAYRAAVQAEQRGALDDAVQFYRQAFRLSPFVDKAYFKEEQRLAQQTAVASERPGDSVQREHQVLHDGKQVLPEALKKLQLETKAVSLQMAGNSTAVATGSLAELISTFPENLTFEPEDETQPCCISSLPDELVILVLRHLDATSLERFALVNKKARVFTLDYGIWRAFVQDAYLYPQVAVDYSSDRAARKFQNDYRRLYIEQPRLRLDGVYIAVCHYIRAGQSENVWVQTSHLVTYHRFLRFFPDGRVISLRANEDQPPQTVIPHMKSESSIDFKDMSIGRWYLDGSTVLVTDLKCMHNESITYSFQMCLRLKSRPLGRWNRLDFVTFESVNIETGEADHLPLKNERSFWFSKVRSFS